MFLYAGEKPTVLVCEGGGVRVWEPRKEPVARPSSIRNNYTYGTHAHTHTQAHTGHATHCEGCYRSMADDLPV